MKTVYIATVEAGHAFAEVVSRGAFQDRDNARKWADAEAAKHLEAANEEDPTFDAYSFNVIIRPLDVIDA